jgi:hypothetical protein
MIETSVLRLQLYYFRETVKARRRWMEEGILAYPYYERMLDRAEKAFHITAGTCEEQRLIDALERWSEDRS